MNQVYQNIILSCELQNLDLELGRSQIRWKGIEIFTVKWFGASKFIGKYWGPLSYENLCSWSTIDILSMVKVCWTTSWVHLKIGIEVDRRHVCLLSGSTCITLRDLNDKRSTIGALGSENLTVTEVNQTLHLYRQKYVELMGLLKWNCNLSYFRNSVVKRIKALEKISQPTIL